MTKASIVKKNWRTIKKEGFLYAGYVRLAEKAEDMTHGKHEN